MARARKRIASIDDAQFKKIEAALGCELPAESREWIVFAIEVPPIFRSMQADLEQTIFQVADDIAAHAAGFERALRTAASSPDISHWLTTFWRKMTFFDVRRPVGRQKNTAAGGRR